MVVRRPLLPAQAPIDMLQKLGRLTHYAFDAVLSMHSCGMR